MSETDPFHIIIHLCNSLLDGDGDGDERVSNTLAWIAPPRAETRFRRSEILISQLKSADWPVRKISIKKLVFVFAF